MTEETGNRYINLSGDRIHTPLRRAFFQAADFKAGLLASGLSFAYYGMRTDDLVLPIASGITTILMNAFICAAIRAFEYTFVNVATFGKTGTLCIDTMPDKNTPPPKASHIQHASYARSLYFGMIAGGVVLDGFRIATGSLASGVDRSLMSFGQYTRYINGYNRFNKLAKGEWVIVDMPPVEKTQPAPAKAKEQAAPTLAPVRT